MIEEGLFESIERASVRLKGGTAWCVWLRVEKRSTARIPRLRCDVLSFFLPIGTMSLLDVAVDAVREECTLSACPRLSSFTASLAPAPGVTVALKSDLRFFGHVYADDFVISAECEGDLQTALDAVSAWRFKSASNLAWDRPSHQQWSLALEKCACLLCNSRRSSCKYLGVVLTPTVAWTLHAQPQAQRVHRLFAQFVSWCRSKQFAFALKSSVFMTSVLLSVALGGTVFYPLSTSSENLGPRIAQVVTLFAGLADRISQCRRLDGA